MPISDLERQRYEEAINFLVKEVTTQERRSNARFMTSTIATTIASIIASASLGFLAGFAYTDSQERSSPPIVIIYEPRASPEVRYFINEEEEDFMPTNIFKHSEIY